MLTMNKAKSLAVTRICRTHGCERDHVRLLDELTQCRRMGWIFFYESRGPVVVSHKGDVHLLDGNRPAAEVLHEFESSVPTRRMRL